MLVFILNEIHNFYKHQIASCPVKINKNQIIFYAKCWFLVD